MNNTLPEIIRQVARGDIVIIVDDHDRENEGDLYVAAQLATPEIINIMVTDARGLVCCPIDHEIAERLALPSQVQSANALHGTNFTVSIDALSCTTGISTFDRAQTITRLADSTARPEDFARPGHVFPIVAAHGGLAERRGHTEAAIELARMAGLPPAGVICEILDRDGSMARAAALNALARTLGILIVSVEDIWNHQNQ